MAFAKLLCKDLSFFSPTYAIIFNSSSRAFILIHLRFFLRADLHRITWPPSWCLLSGSRSRSPLELLCFFNTQAPCPSLPFPSRSRLPLELHSSFSSPELFPILSPWSPPSRSSSPLQLFYLASCDPFKAATCDSSSTSSSPLKLYFISESESNNLPICYMHSDLEHFQTF